MNLNFILFVLIPFVLMLAITIGMPFYRIELMKKAGEKKLALVSKSARLSYITSAIAVILLILSILIDFGRMNFVIPYCAVLGFFVATRESTFLPVNGVYENLLIVGSEILLYKDILEIPESSNPPEATSLTIITKSHKQRQLTFNNTNETHEVLSVLREKV